MFDSRLKFDFVHDLQGWSFEWCRRTSTNPNARKVAVLVYSAGL